jgi:hypothetical protein
MTREQLIKKGSSVVRNDATAFSFFKSFLIEDWGAIPDGCFGCQFSTYFDRWKKQVLNGTTNQTKEKILINKSTNMNSYTLKDKNFKTYFMGEVLSVNSSDAEWVTFLKKHENQKSKFLVLPSEFSTPKEKEEESVVVEAIEKKNVKSTKKASVEVVNEVVNDSE